MAVDLENVRAFIVTAREFWLDKEGRGPIVEAAAIGQLEALVAEVEGLREASRAVLTAYDASMDAPYDELKWDAMMAVDFDGLRELLG